MILKVLFLLTVNTDILKTKSQCVTFTKQNAKSAWSFKKQNQFIFSIDLHRNTTGKIHLCYVGHECCNCLKFIDARRYLLLYISVWCHQCWV